IMNERQKEHREFLKNKILNTAIKLFESGGIENIKMRKVAGKIKYSATVIYSYFSNKEELLFEILHSKLNRLVNELRHIEGDDEEKLLREMINTYVDFFVVNHEYYYLYTKINLSKINIDPEQRESLINAPIFPFGRVFDRLVMNGSKKGDYTNHLYLLWAFMNGLIELKLNRDIGDTVNIEKVIEEFAKYIVSTG
ncbi:TetR/AcrR family transcriptional regulator, partial [candidate division WOR-3 bacterium]|nr:TetR/AcrR family transcriptional regulator [candidate division WOR-3 bacterium]